MTQAQTIPPGTDRRQGPGVPANEAARRRVIAPQDALKVRVIRPTGQTPIRPEAVEIRGPGGEGLRVEPPALPGGPSAASLRASLYNPPPPPPPPVIKSPVEEITGVVLPAGGGIMGGVRGAATGARLGPWGAVVGGVLGSMAGETAGEGAQMGVESLGWAGPPTAEEAQQRLTTAAALAGGGELAAQGLLKGWGVVRRAARGFSSKVDDVGKAAYERLEGNVLPSQVADSPTLHFLDNIVRGSMLGRGARERFISDQERRLSEEVMHEIMRFGPPIEKEALGDVVQAARQAGLDKFTQVSDQLYQEAHRLAGAEANLPVDTLIARTEALLKPYIDEVGGDLPGAPTGYSLLQRIQRMKPPPVDETEMIQSLGMSVGELKAKAATDPGMKSLLGQLEQAGIVKAGNAGPSPRTFEELTKLRSDLLLLKREANATKNKKLRGIAEQLIKETDATIEAGLAQNPKALEAWRFANQFYKEGQERFNTKFLRELAKKDPSHVARNILNEGQSSPARIRAVRTAVGGADAGAWRAVQSDAAQFILKADEAGNVITGDALVKRLTKLGNDRLREVFPNGEHRSFWELARVLQKLAPTKEGTGKMYIQFAQAGAITAGVGAGVGFLTGDVKAGTLAALGSGGAVILTPKLLAKIMTSDKGRRWLIEGLQAPPGSPLATRAATQLGLILAETSNDPTAKARNAPPPKPQGGRGGGPPQRPVSAPRGRGPGGG